MTPWIGQVRNIRSTKAKEDNSKGKALSSSATSYCFCPLSLQKHKHLPPYLLCGVPWKLLTTKATQPGSPWDHGQLLTFPLPPTIFLLTLNLPRPLPHGWEAHSDSAQWKGHRIRSWMDLGSPWFGWLMGDQRQIIFLSLSFLNRYRGYKKSLSVFHRSLCQANKITDVESTF